MVKSGPKTYAQRATDAAIIPGNRAPVPPDLEPEAAVLWEEVVNRLPADWFTAETRPLLREYCRHALYAEIFAREIAAMRVTLNELRHTLYADKVKLVKDPAVSKEIDAKTHELHELHKMHGYESNLLMQLATKLRLTQQSRYFPDKAGSKSRETTPTGPRPWQDWGDESTTKN